MAIFKEKNWAGDPLFHLRVPDIWKDDFDECLKLLDFKCTDANNDDRMTNLTILN
jgi:hypothetical protein